MMTEFLRHFVHYVALVTALWTLASFVVLFTAFMIYLYASEATLRIELPPPAATAEDTWGLSEHG